MRMLSLYSNGERAFAHALRHYKQTLNLNAVFMRQKAKAEILHTLPHNSRCADTHFVRSSIQTFYTFLDAFTKKQ